MEENSISTPPLPATFNVSRPMVSKIMASSLIRVSAAPSIPPGWRFEVVPFLKKNHRPFLVSVHLRSHHPCH